MADPRRAIGWPITGAVRHSRVRRLAIVAAESRLNEELYPSSSPHASVAGLERLDAERGKNVRTRARERERIRREDARVCAQCARVEETGISRSRVYACPRPLARARAPASGDLCVLQAGGRRRPVVMATIPSDWPQLPLESPPPTPPPGPLMYTIRHHR